MPTKRTRKPIWAETQASPCRGSGDTTTTPHIAPNALTLAIPAALPSWNVFYAGAHWRERSECAKSWKLRMIAAVRSAKGYAARLYYGYDVVDIFVTVRHKSKRRRDSDNICAKLAIDGLKDAGVIADDDPRYVRIVSTQAVQADRDETLITITPVDPSQKLGIGD